MYREPYERPSELVRLMGPIGRQRALDREQQQKREEQREKRAEAATRSARTVGGWLVAFIIAVLAGVISIKLAGGLTRPTPSSSASPGYSS
jgi:hypothetical protein